MYEKSYIDTSPGKIRVKIVHVSEATPDLYVDESELSTEIVEALKRSRQTSSTTTYPREFEALNPAPTVVSLDTEDVEKLVALVKAKTGYSLYERAVKIGFDGGVFILAVEHHCG
ncbi:MAG: hypothetical protein QXF45_04250 [Candidatus Caldarchaeum sp.]